MSSPLFIGMAFVLGIFFTLVGVVYGRVAGTMTRPREVVDAMVEGIKSMAPILVLFFAISQFLAYFKWTGLGEILAIKGAESLRDISAPGWAILLGIAVLVTFMNLIITSGSALWSLAAPVFVPMLMLLDINPETTQAIYRVADSVHQLRHADEPLLRDGPRLRAALPEVGRDRHAGVVHDPAGRGHLGRLGAVLPGLVPPRHPARPGRTRRLPEVRGTPVTHLDAATAAAARILDDITALVEVETSSYDKAALDTGLAHVERLLAGHLGEPDESRRHDGGSVRRRADRDVRRHRDRPRGAGRALRHRLADRHPGRLAGRHRRGWTAATGSPDRGSST